MATTPMKRVTAVVTEKRAQGLVKKLLHLGCVSPQVCPAVEDGLEHAAPSDRVGELTRESGRIDRALALLHRQQSRAPLVPCRQQVDFSAYEGSQAYREAQEVLAQAEALMEEEKHQLARAQTLQEKRAVCLPWQGYSLPLGLSETAECTLLLGTFPAGTQMEETVATLDQAGAVTEQVSQDGAGVYAAVLFRKGNGPAQEALARAGFLRQNFGFADGTAAQTLADLAEKERRLAQDVQAREAAEHALAERVGALEVLSDYIHTRITEENVQGCLGRTECTRFLTGWVPGQAEAAVTAVLEKEKCAYAFTEPTEEDNVPVLLNNPSFFRPFEMVMGIYSLPRYGTFDPTCIMAFFYALIFGLMMADVGYGLILFAGCTIALRLPRFRAMGDYLRLFRDCGVACMVCGVLFGGWFGDLPTAIFGAERVPGFIANGLLPDLNPMAFDKNGPVHFMIFTLAVGFVHIFTGMGIKFVLLCREGKVFDAICDIGSWFVLFGGVVALLLETLVFGTGTRVGMYVALGGAAMIVLTTGRREKNVVMKFLKGLLGLYGVINYASDILSYSRILALGLASAVIAMVINLLTGLAGVGPAMLIVAIPLMVVAHLLSLALNLLGTFVHTSRLQFIEFFGKFFEEGGEPFAPAKEENTYTENVAPLPELAAKK